MVSAQISVYPLRRQHLTPVISAVCGALEAHGLHPEVGPMSTVVSGEMDIVFAALRDAFEGASSGGQVAMVVTISNACPT